MTASPQHTHMHTHHSTTPITPITPRQSAIFPSAEPTLTSAEIRARISEITTFLDVSRRWLRERAARERAINRDWAYSGGW